MGLIQKVVKDEKATVGIRVPKALKTRLERLQSEVKQLGYEFTLADEFEKWLDRKVSESESELVELKKKALDGTKAEAQKREPVQAGESAQAPLGFNRQTN